MQELIGIESPSVFEQAPYRDWFEPEYSSYLPETKVIANLKQTGISAMNFLLFFGSWCEDSQLQVPRLLKIFDSLELPDSQLKLIVVNQSKDEPIELLQQYSIQFVPTLIVLSNQRQIGQIVEHPKTQTLENDLLEMSSTHPK